MTFAHFNRRLHLYMGLGLLPWFIMYGVSSIGFTHSLYFQERDAAKGLPQWTLRLERTIDLPVPTADDQLPAFGASVLQQVGVDAPNVVVSRPNPDLVNINAFSFLHYTRVRYSVKQKKVTVEDRRFRWEQFLTGMHTRGGYRLDGFVRTSWSVVVDLVSIGVILWIASGLYMWWGVSGHRRWGWLAILSGVASFVFFASRL